MERVLEAVNDGVFPTFQQTDDERLYVDDAWRRFQDCFVIKQQGQDIFNGQQLQAVWDESTRDYAVISGVKENLNDPVQPYVSTISRDKSDVFISNLSGSLLMPSVIAQNADQEIDKIMGRVSRSMLEWAHWNDGWPSETGNQKFARYVHKQVVEGTVHILDDVSKEDGLTSELVPNEEMFIPNFWQPNIQLQPYIIRAKINILYEELEMAYGHYDNFKYVLPGYNDFWYVQRPLFKPLLQGVLLNQNNQVLYIWKQLTPDELKKAKADGRVPRKAKRANWYNIIINNVPMLPVDNIQPYKDGYFPINKGIFAKTAKAEYYWGMPMPYKVREDKKWLDAWKTLIRYKAKLSVLKPLISLNGNFVDEQIILPAKITPVTEEMEIKTIAGIGDPVNQSDVNMLQMAQAEIDRGSLPPSASGQQDQGGSMTAREAVINASYTQKMIDGFQMEVAALAHARSMPILLRLYQFLPRRTIKKLAIPEQTLSDGTRGTIEILFKPIGQMTDQEELKASFAMRSEERKSRKRKQPKEMVQIDPGYLDEITLYLRTDARSASEDNTLLKQNTFMKNLKEIYLNNPNINQHNLFREAIRINEDNDDLLAEEQQAAPGAPPSPTPPGAPQAPQSPQAAPIPGEGQQIPDMARQAMSAIT